MKKTNSYSEMLRHENEITKLKIQAEFGVELKGESDLNPALENIWLNQILEYERLIANSDKITVHEFIGAPIFKTENEISDEDMPREVQTLMFLLNKKSIMVDCKSQIDDREMYRFITEELFVTETESATPKNTITCFIYEEFHPNDEEELRRYTTEFINMFTDKEDDSWIMHLSPYSESEESEVRLANLKRKIENFREAFDEIKLNEFDITSVHIKEQYAEVNFDFSIAVKTMDKKSFFAIEDSGQIVFSKEESCWFIIDIKMKGVV